MNVWLALALSAGAGGVVFRWSRSRVDALGRPEPFPTFSVGLLVCLALVALAPWFLRIRLENRLADAASKIVGTPVSIHCQSFGEAFTDMGAELGFVMFGPDGVPEKKATIKRNQCRDLNDYLKSDKSAPQHNQVVAVHTLTHEAIHMSGITDESVTECLAVQRDAEVAALLGASPQEAMNLALSYWTFVYPRMPAGYTSNECGSGLALDIEGDHAPWDEVTEPVNDTL